ncbi:MULTISPECIES: hypothetical protein [unclassified Streptomyces]|uniref:hypothetical protein n=1 Tax=unclassified Streptomyces TaxID=2593676 RepID=UPI00131BD2C6|nr:MULTISPECIES: hypothetical protein [unclassified Streptomyces]MDP9954158.1 hypothetical protein [Streptomyces sp. DSM 41269]
MVQEFSARTLASNSARARLDLGEAVGDDLGGPSQVVLQVLAVDGVDVLPRVQQRALLDLPVAALRQHLLERRDLGGGQGVHDGALLLHGVLAVVDGVEPAVGHGLVAEVRSEGDAARGVHGGPLLLPAGGCPWR